MPESKTFFVRALKGINFNGRVGEHQFQVAERDDAHPNGEAFVAGPDPVEVGDTPTVQRAIRDGLIEEVSESDFKAVQKERQEAAQRALAASPVEANRAAREAATMQSQIADRERSVAAQEADLEKREQALKQQEAEISRQRADLDSKRGK